MSKFAYYNEFDPKAAAWIKQLIKNGMIADGEVDERSITEVTADEIRGFTQHHFFAGIGGWSYSLRLAGWADDRPVCTASLPCQPFSVAGAQKGVYDERHLLPHFIELVKQCNFQTIFGEQVPGAIKHGWLDDLCTEMEREKYRVGQIVLTAAGEGAPHIRQRLFWVADSINKGSQGRLSGWQDTERETINRHSGCSGTVGRVGISSSLRLESERAELETAGVTRTSKIFDGLANSESARAGENERGLREMPDGHSRMGDNSSERLEGGARESVQGTVDGFTSASSRMGDTELHGYNGSEIRRSIGESEIESGMLKSEGSNTEWTDPEWLYCRDEKYRPIKSSSIRLVNGFSCRMVQCSDTSVSHIETIKKEMKNAEKTTSDTREILPTLQCENGKEKIPKHNRGYDSLYEAEVLQSRVNGEGLRMCDENNNIAKQSSAIKETSQRMLSGVWKNTHTSCSSCGRESYEQLTIEFDDVMLEMPQGSTLTELFGPDGSEYMQTLRQASDESRSVLDSQYALSKIWESLDDKEKDRVRVHFDNRIWVFTEGLKPLANGLPRGVGYSNDPSESIDANNTQEARVMRLKGYGNAIVPKVAASFIKAFMEAT